MAITYSWSFSALDVELGPDAEDHTDVVYTIHWRYSATDEEDPPHTASSIGTSSVKWEESEPWIPYEDLTEAAESFQNKFLKSDNLVLAANLVKWLKH